MLAQLTTTTSSSSDGLSAGATLAIVAFVLAVGILHLAGMWKVLIKGGEPGGFALFNLVACLTPFSFIPVMRMVGRPTWWVVLFFVPIVNIVVIVIVSIELAKSFGKGTVYGIGLALLAPIFYIMLGFGSSTYRGSSAAA